MTTLFLIIMILYFMTGIDDAFIDFYAILFGLKPTEIDRQVLADVETRDFSYTKNSPPKFAIVVPAWDEANVIGRMIKGNLNGIDYPKNAYDFYIGVYPNDNATLEVVRELESKHENVHGIVSPIPGPTSKGQILNHVAQVLTTRPDWDAMLLHDAEDLIHPQALRLIALELDSVPYVQIPVFSLPVGWSDFVAGTYIDEFAESHTKDVLVRAHSGAPIPSAGVGTTLRRDMLEVLLANGAPLLNEGSLTEDYELGIRIGLQKFKQTFAARYLRKTDGTKDFIATREYFPKSLRRSIRQKSRWTVGITLQGWRNLRWQGNTASRYFLARDRKGLLTNPATAAGYALFGAGVLVESLIPGTVNQYINTAPPDLTAEFIPMAGATIALATNRFCQRAICVARVYGWRTAFLSTARWPVAGFVNATAAFRALYQHTKSRWSKQALRWIKTEHELPEDFGLMP